MVISSLYDSTVFYDQMRLNTEDTQHSNRYPQSSYDCKMMQLFEFRGSVLTSIEQKIKHFGDSR